MLARDLMTRDVIYVREDAATRDVIRILAEYGVSGLPVLNNDRELVGIVTEADVLGRVGAAVTDIMTRRVITATEATPTDQIAQLITGNRIKRVPIVRDNQVVGIVSRADLVRELASRWVCGTCGAIHLGQMPQECDACGAPGAIFGRQIDPRTEISARY
ncbi:MAG: CBS domain-containing protein [Ktedonobacterales bacterium]|nr:CBS domain-containing protein [Ktedonobacterales bacterium]